MIPAAPEERDALAGEYVLGALDAEATREIEAALPRDADLARRVAAWEERLLPALDAAHAPAAADPGLWRRIEATLADRPLALPPVRRLSFAARAWRSAPLWRGVAALATAAAVALAVVPVRDAQPEPPRFYALLQARDAAGQETGPGWLLQIGADGVLRSTPLGRVEAGEGRALQLWTLWDPARGPVSLGVLPAGGAVRLPRDRLPTIGGGQLFEITLEPPAGSPTGRPTGRILYIGRAAQAETRNF